MLNKFESDNADDIILNFINKCKILEIEVNEITKNLEVVLLKAVDRWPLNCFDKSK